MGIRRPTKAMRTRAVLLSVLLFAALPFSGNPAGAAEADDFEPLIVGGVEAEAGEFPFMTSLLLATARGPAFNCGASLIASTWVLTAAHCVENRSESEVTFVVGQYDRGEPGGESRSSKRIIMHPGYSMFDYPNDLALVELSEPATAPVIALATAEEMEAAATATVIGWGDTQTPLGFPDILLKVEVPLISDADCLASGIGDLIDPDVMMCAGESGKDSCGGDSGGPLLIADALGAPRQVGVVSFGEGCAEPDFPGVYVELPAFMEWIESHTGPLSTTPDTITVTVTCADGDEAGTDRGQVDVTVTNNGGSFASYRTTIGTRNARQTSMSAGTSITVAETALPNGSTQVTVTRGDETIYDAPTTIDCVVPIPPITSSGQVGHAVSCLAGNGRVDTNIVNVGDSTADYRLEFEGLTPRQRAVTAGDWWRTPITGRADGSYVIVVKRAGSTVSTQTVVVDCDSETPTVSSPEIQVVNSCRDNNGYILFQFVNSSAVQKPYVIEFETVNNRSTSAAAFGASVRAVTGRADGTYDVLVRSKGKTVAAMELSVSCDGNLG